MGELNDAIVNGVHNYSPEEKYVEPGSPVKERLEWFKDLKLGLMMHWGIYTEAGLIASWGLSDDDADWARDSAGSVFYADWTRKGNEYRRDYYSLARSFNPIRFLPEKWAQFAADNCFKYLVFTTKHHDGFCMWDTKYSDLKITSDDCPFHTNKRADIVRHVFDAFREKGLGIGAYFSKPDWHSEYYWAKNMEHSDPTWRMPSYDVKKYPELWEKFTQYTQNQMTELVRDYGKIDILWLDGGQVTKENGLDIRLGEEAEKLRQINPELIIADRTAGGIYENFITPEQKVPEKALNVPWESCMTAGRDFSYMFDDEYKTPEFLINMLIDIVCKGGNLLLNLSPQPDGRLPENGMKALSGLGDWLKKYGEAIFKTRPIAPYKKDNVAFTEKDGIVYALAPYMQNIFIPYTGNISKIELLNTHMGLSYREANGGIKINSVPQTGEKAAIAVFKIYS